ncbi:MAG: hypothetical protein JOY58_02865 [Solirubrobacterales bacterium]|nr:hypothetical protein [Solirubrobacterales bacterium]MBV9047179.1 hypothetical protein [Solirubrobacterales bacterium]
MSIGAVIAIGVGAATVAGFALSALTYWITQRRVRPIVICHEHQKRHIRHEATRGYWVSSVYLTNESTTGAFNVRFGIDMAGRHVSWKHDQEDEKASRLNVLRPNGRHPDDNGVVDVFINDRMLWHLTRRGRRWRRRRRAHLVGLQPGPGWRLVVHVQCVRPHRPLHNQARSEPWVRPVSRGNRELVKSIERGAAIRTQAIRDLNEAADEMRRAREEDRDAAPDNELTADA